MLPVAAAVRSGCRALLTRTLVAMPLAAAAAAPSATAEGAQKRTLEVSAPAAVGAYVILHSRTPGGNRAADCCCRT